MAVIDCYDREIIGWEFALRGRVNEAERALDTACLAQFGTLRPNGEVPIIRSDNGLIFQCRRFRDACRLYRLSQEFITPYTPEQNGLIERWFRSLKEACVWQHQFHTFVDAKQGITAWIHWGQRGTSASSPGLSQSAVSAATAARRLAAWGSTDVYQVPKSSWCVGYMWNVSAQMWEEET